MRMSLVVVITVFIVMMSAVVTLADEPPVVDRAMKATMVDSICLFLKENYVFEDQAAKISSHMRRQLKKGAYDAVSDPEDLASALTADLQSVNHDRHLRVVHAPEFIRVDRADTGHGGIGPEQIREAQNDNFGFYKLERLPGNIGYLDLRRFESTLVPRAGQTAVAAMQFLAHSRAIIFDLRQNGGGYPEMIQLLSTYLFDEEQHLNDLRSRPEGFTHQYWTLSFVPGERMPDVPVYVLTSRRTFSGAEEFANNLRELKRATLVGEPTRGGAHAGQGMIINDYFAMFMPTSEAINPVSKSNWEGTGVIPHIAAPADSALDIAHLHALRRLLEASSEERVQKELQAALSSKEAQMSSVKVPVETLKSYEGQYGIRRVLLNGESLYFQREQGPKFRLLPVSDVTFIIDEVGGRVTFTRDAAGAVNGFELVRAPGDTVQAMRTE